MRKMRQQEKLNTKKILKIILIIIFIFYVNDFGLSLPKLH